MHELEDRVDVDGGEVGLVAVTVEAVVDVSGAGHDAAAAGSLLLLLVMSPSSRVAPFLVLGLFPPGSYTSLHLLPLLMFVGLCGWSQSLLLWLVMLVTSMLGMGNALLLLQLWSPVLSSSPCAVLSSTSPLGLMWLVRGACTCGFIIESTSSFPMLETLSSSRAQWLFNMTSVSSGGLGDAAVIDKGGGGVSS